MSYTISFLRCRWYHNITVCQVYSSLFFCDKSLGRGGLYNGIYVYRIVAYSGYITSKILINSLRLYATNHRNVFLRHASGVGSTMSRFDKYYAVKPSGMPHSPATRGAREYFVSASNIEHPVVIPRDVLFRPVSGSFLQRYYQCISPSMPNPPKFPQLISLAQKSDASCT